MATRLNGIEFPVKTEATARSVALGEVQARGTNGGGYRAARRYHREWEVSAGPMTAEEARAWTCLVQGDGDHWSFDVDGTSANGIALASGALSIVAGGRHGSAASITSNVAWNVGAGTEWSAALFRRPTSGDPWEWWLVRSDRTAFKDGAPATVPSWLALSNGTLQITTVAGQIDEMVMLRARVPSTWVEDLRLFMLNQPYPDLPMLRLEGDLPGTAVLVLGEVSGADLYGFMRDGTLNEAGQDLSVLLREK